MRRMVVVAVQDQIEKAWKFTRKDKCIAPVWCMYGNAKKN